MLSGKLLFIVGLVCLFTAGAAAGNNSDPGKRVPVYAFGQSYELNQNIGRIGPGVLLGTTTYDVQQMCSMGRQVEHRNADYLHFSWTRQTQMTHPGDRTIVYQAYNLKTCEFLFVPELEVYDAFSGYISLDADPNGCAVIGGNLKHNPNPPNLVSKAFWDVVCLGEPVGFFLSDFPEDVYGWYANNGVGPGNENLWPKIDWQVGTESVLHMVATESVDHVDHVQSDVKTISYYRRTGPYGYQTPVWSTQMVIDTVTNNSVIVVASPVSDDVAIVWCAPMESMEGVTGAYNHPLQNDVWYMRSFDQGNTWLTPVNVTQYSRSSNWRAACDISALFTSDDMLHIVWNCRRWFGPADYMFKRQAGLFHWSEDNPLIRTVYKAFWDDDAGSCDGHEWGADVGKMSLSECDSRLYVLFSQFGQYGDLCDDVATSNNLENGELYMTVSTDGGLSWDQPQNLTNTVSHNCPPGDCESDYWASMARYGRIEDAGCQGMLPDDHVLDILYINDRNPGSAVSLQDNAIWTENNVMWLPTLCREAVPVGTSPDACCLPDGSCVHSLTVIECEIYGGVWYPNTPCDPNPCLVDIYGSKYFDENRNSIRDGNDGPLQNWTITLSAGGNLVATQTTDINGEYAFTDMLPGVYTVSELFPTDKLWIQTCPAPWYYTFNIAPGQDRTGIDFGNWTRDTLGQTNCIKPADGLFDWWPLNEAGITIAYDIAGRRDGVRKGTVTEGMGKVRGAYNMTAANQGFVRVYDDPFKYIGSQDFTLDAWIYLEDCTVASPICNKRIIMDNHRCGVGNGITFFMEYDPGGGTWRIGLKMNQAPPFYSSSLGLTLDTWNHVAVTVSRQTDPGSGHFYFNGIANGPEFVPVVGNLFSPPFGCIWPILDIGHAPPDYKCTNNITHYYFDGWMDEVEIFRKALTSAEVLDLFQKDYMGKCYEHCSVPSSKMFCLNDFSRTVRLTICNESNLDAYYSWDIYGFIVKTPSGGSGFVPGTFSPQNQNNLFIPAWQCRHFDITIDRPQNGFYNFNPGDIAYYDVIVENETTGGNFMCRGSLFAGNNFCTRGPDFKETPFYELHVGDTANIEYLVKNTGDSLDGAAAYEIAVVAACDCDSTMVPGVSLNGLPLGTPVTGSVDIPYGDSTIVSVMTELTNYQPHIFAEVVLRMDWDEDGSIDSAGYAVLIHPRTFPDCNENGVHDSVDIAEGFDADTNSNWYPDECEFNEEPCYVAGDANHDGQTNVGDAVYLISYIFAGGPMPPCPAEGDANGDCQLNVGDAVYLISYVFKGGDPPLLNDECTWP